MSAAIALLLACARQTELRVHPDDPLHRLVELSVDEQGVVVEAPVDFEGTLHVWAHSHDVDPSLRAETAGAAGSRADDDSGGGTTAWLSLAVAPGSTLLVHVACAPGQSGVVDLHLVAAPETAATRAAAERGLRGVDDARRLRGAGEHRAAHDRLREVVDTLSAVEGGEHSEAVATALDAAGFTAWGFDFETSRDARQLVLRHRERVLPPDHHEVQNTRGNLAVALRELGDLVQASVLGEQVYETCRRTLSPDHPDLLAAALNLATVRYLAGELHEAVARMEEVVSGYERTVGPDDLNLARARGNLSLMLEAAGDLTRARVLAEQTIAAFAKAAHPDHPDVLRAKSRSAHLARESGDFVTARALREEIALAAERAFPEGNRELLVHRSLLGLALFQTGDLDAARAVLEDVLREQEQRLPPGDATLLDTRQYLGGVLAELGDVDGALELAEQTLAVGERFLPQGGSGLRDLRLNTAARLREAGEREKARAMEEDVLAAELSVRPPDHPDVLLARQNLAITLAQRDQGDALREQVAELAAGIRARALATAALAPREARALAAAEAKRLDLLFSWSTSPEEHARLFELIETMRVVAVEAERAIAAANAHPEIARLFAEAVEVGAALNQIVGGTTEEGPAELLELGLRRDALLGEAARRLRASGVRVEAVERGELARALPDGHAAAGLRQLSRWRVDRESGRTEIGPPLLVAHVLRSDGTLRQVDLGPTAEIEQLVLDWRRALGRPLVERGVSPVGSSAGVASELEPGRRLRERLFDPLLAASGGARTLHLCADGAAFLVPLDALPLDGAGDGRVGDEVRVVSESSFARLVGESAPPRVEPSLTLLGGVEYGPADPGGPALEPLPGTGAEVEAVAALFERAEERDVSVLAGRAADKPALLAGLADRRYVHLATHAWFSDEGASPPRTRGSAWAPLSARDRAAALAPLTLCGFAVAGANGGRDSLGRFPGIVSGQELLEADLSECELAVLSACETSVGVQRAGQGIQSLQTALHAAGARTTITSLWKVDDDATRELMERFYTSLWIDGLSKAEALWRAKSSLRAEGRPVRDWAAWVLSGEPD